MNFSFLEVDTSRISACPANRASTIAGTAFLPRYHDKKIRSRIKDELRSLRLNGFAQLRTHLFFGALDNRPRDWFDVDNDAEVAGRNLAAYVADVAEAGFSRLTIAFGSQGKIAPACNRNAWSDCFEIGGASRASEFITAVRSALSGHFGMAIAFDLVNEGCSTPSMPKALRENLNSYVRTVVSKYVKAFPHDETTVSCSIERFIDGRRAIDEAYAAAGRKPNFYQIHSYHRRGRPIMGTLLAVSRTLRDIDEPIVLGEVSYGSSKHLARLEQMLKTAQGGLAGVVFWPLRTTSSRCHVDVAPPYSLRAARGVSE